MKMPTDASPPLDETHPHLKGFLSYLETHNDESGRGRALVSAAMLDDLLFQTLRAFLVEGRSSVKLFEGGTAPLSTLSARIAACHAMGLITDEEAHDATLIRKVRNEFAHTLSASFADQRIAEWCRRLHHRAPDYDDTILDAAAQFSTASTSLILHLTNRPHYAGKERLTPRDWPY